MIWEEGTNSAVAFHTQFVVCLICNSLHCLPYNSHDNSWENLVWDQPTISVFVHVNCATDPS